VVAFFVGGTECTLTPSAGCRDHRDFSCGNTGRAKATHRMSPANCSGTMPPAWNDPEQCGDNGNVARMTRARWQDVHPANAAWKAKTRSAQMPTPRVARGRKRRAREGDGEEAFATNARPHRSDRASETGCRRESRSGRFRHASRKRRQGNRGRMPIKTVRQDAFTALDARKAGAERNAIAAVSVGSGESRRGTCKRRRQALTFPWNISPRTNHRTQKPQSRPSKRHVPISRTASRSNHQPSMRSGCRSSESCEQTDEACSGQLTQGPGISARDRRTETPHKSPSE